MGGPHVWGVRGNKAGRPARITPRVLQRGSSPPAPTPLVGMASKANCRNRDEEQPPISTDPSSPWPSRCVPCSRKQRQRLPPQHQPKKPGFQKRAEVLRLWVTPK